MSDNRRFYKDMLFFSLTNFFWPLGKSMYIYFFPIHIRQLGGSEWVVGLAISIPLVAGILCLAGGVLADYMDRKNIVLFGWGVTIPAPLIWAFADRWEWLLVGTVIYSFTMVCVPAITLYIFDHESPGNKMQAYSLYSISSMLGSIVGPSVGGIILEEYGSKSLFLLIFLLYALATACILPMSGQRRRAPLPVSQSIRSWRTVLALAIKPLVTVIAFLAVISFIQNLSDPYLSLFLNEAKAVPLARIGMAFTALSAGSALFMWLYGKFDGKVNMHHNLLAGIVVFLTSLALTVYANHIVVLMLAFFLRGVVGALAVYILGSIANRLSGGNKGLTLSLFVALRNILIGAAAYPGALLYPIHPYLLFYAEGALIAVWAMLSFHPVFRSFFHKHEPGEGRQ